MAENDQTQEEAATFMEYKKKEEGFFEEIYNDLKEYK